MLKRRAFLRANGHDGVVFGDPNTPPTGPGNSFITAVGLACLVKPFGVVPMHKRLGQRGSACADGFGGKLRGNSL
jgi:hypothetical protein